MIPSLCFSNTNLELFFECLKLKDYECASLHVNNQKDEALARKMIKLLKILEFQKPLIEKSKYLKSAKGHEVIDNLIEGHNELFLDNYSSIIAYEAFSKALNESNLKDNKELTILGKDKHGLNIFFNRVLFCFYAEDSKIFKDGLFTKSIISHTLDDGSDLANYLNNLFEV